ncbi:catechol 2,3-dioxygenase-like lactoylglutathione lyase family enzyme [Variovorax sp. GrIS 2.14]|jgi:catechol 2,3-dioxygenase-like lactoylglutathione lyase family enzyme|uniref:hypothetical protein n=1 Tax=unclassified Variovorax TaxID=663243 RepID=UPI002B233C9E|nr:hypothetical protein [Variovorax sp. RTB1]MEB0113708.1 hypothetical protein [Variovorax sp. RTB1]
MWPALDRSAFQGVRLAVPDLAAAVGFARQVLGLERASSEAADTQDIARFRLGAHWLAFERQSAEILPTLSSNHLATLHWRCSDLRRQRTLLTQLGFDSQDESELDPVPPVRVVAAETGACALQWDAEAAPIGGDLPSSSGITGVVLHTRAPERAAAHWAQIFQVSVERHATGVPRLVLDRLSVQFVFADERAGGIGRITLALDDAGAVRDRAIASGATVDGDAIAIAGLTISLANAPASAR